MNTTHAGAVKAGLVGCGFISDIYLQNLTRRFGGPEVVACADLDAARARAQAARYGIRAAQSPEALFQDPGIELIINLTTPLAHRDVILSALRHGKHVYTEKPLATCMEDADAILGEATKRGLLVGCSPDTLLGGGLQTVLKAVDDGRIGKPLAATAFWSSRGHERWHPNPAFYYQPGAGPLLDMGPYYITALVAALGPATRVEAMSGRAFRERVIATGPKAGTAFPVAVDTHFSAGIRMACGAVVTAMFSFDVWAARLPRMELYGTEGTLSVPDPNTFGGDAQLYTPGAGDYETLAPVSDAVENMRGIGASQMSRAIRTGEPLITDIGLTYHVLEILCSMEQSARTGLPVTLKSTYEKPPFRVYRPDGPRDTT